MEKYLELKHITKRFPGVTALSDVSFDVHSGEVHALLGENGAGKSTLIKILAGIYKKDEGEIFIGGRKVEISSPSDAKENNISVIHQELMLVPHLTVAENVFLGSEQKNALGLIDFQAMNRVAQKLIETFGLSFAATSLLKELSIADQQMVEILRAVSFGAKIVVMDEPTSSLTEKEVEILFHTIHTLKSQEVSIIYISHRLSELDAIADRVTVLRDGKYIATVDKKETTTDELVTLMVGRKVESFYTKTSSCRDEVVLEAKDLSDGGRVKAISFRLHKGEILGFSGLVGAGRTEMAQCLYGVRPVAHGAVEIRGKREQITSPQKANELGIGFVPEDRKELGLYMVNTVQFNITLNVLRSFLKGCRYDARKEYVLADETIRKLEIKVTEQGQLVSQLSGGNQQKIIIGRWLLTDSSILIFDEPTRGIDVNAKAEIYALMDALTNSGISIIFISSDLPELLNMCDRIVVVNAGHTTGVLNKDEFSQETIMKYATQEVM